MAIENTLPTVAEIALGLAGFSGIAIVLTRSGGRLLRFEAYRLGILLGTTLGATFLALLPLVLLEFGIERSTALRFSSAVMSAFTIVFMAYFISAIRYLRTTMPEIATPGPVITVLTLHAVNVAAQIFAAAARSAHWSGIYLAGCCWLLAHGAYQFGRILFIRPRSDTEPTQPVTALTP
jgi:hypothetical protein